MNATCILHGRQVLEIWTGAWCH